MLSSNGDGGIRVSDAARRHEPPNRRKELSMFVTSLVTLFATVSAAGADGAPDGLSASDWSGIHAAYHANRHAAFAVEGGYQACNPGQAWRTRFDGRGFMTTPDAG